MEQLQSLHIQNLGAIRGGRPVFRRLDLTIKQGQIIALRGPNGCGKTSLLRTLSGLLKPVRGKIIKNNMTPLSFPFLHAQDFAWIAHGSGIKSGLTAIENLNFLCELMPSGNKALMEEALEKMTLLEVAHKQARFYSAGQMRRLALCRLIICPSPLWMLDEPLNALDKHGRKMLKTMILDHAKQGGMVILADHEGFLEQQAINFDMNPFAIRHQKECANVD